MKLENWSLSIYQPDPYLAPEACPSILIGDVYGHPDSERFYDGKCIQTSRLVDVKDGVAYTKSGSEYILGEVDPEYEKAYPNALERMEKMF